MDISLDTSPKSDYTSIYKSDFGLKGEVIYGSDMGSRIKKI